MEGLKRYLLRAGLPPEMAESYAAMDNATGGADASFAVGGAPLARSIWGTVSVRKEFLPNLVPTRAVIAATMEGCLEFVAEAIAGCTIYEDTTHGTLFSRTLIDGLKVRKFFGLAIPTEYGGEGATLSEMGPFLSALTLLDPDLAILFEVHGILGPVSPLLLFGTEEQKGFYLPRLARGELLGSFALTEAGAGGDPSVLITTATLDGENYRLTGNKVFITNFTAWYGNALSVVTCRLDGHGLPNDRNTGALILEFTNTPPASLHYERNDLLAFEALFNARIRFTDHLVPAANLLGKPGKGLMQAFAMLERGRMGICANAVGKIRRALAEVIGNGRVHGWVRVRSTFGELLVEKPAVREYLGRGAMAVVVSEALRDWCAGLGDRKVRDEAAGFVAKLYASEALATTVLNSFRLQGGRSSFVGNYLSEHLVDYLMALIYEGPNEVLRDVGGPGALVREIRKDYLDPALGAITGRMEGEPEAEYLARKQGWFGKLFRAGKLLIGIFLSPAGRTVDVEHLSPDLRSYVRRALARNRSIGRSYAWLLARHGLAFARQTLETGRLFEQLTYSTAALITALAVRDRGESYHLIARAAHLHAECKINGLEPTLELRRLWARLGGMIATPGESLFIDMVEGLRIGGISLDPSRLEDYFTR